MASKSMSSIPVEGVFVCGVMGSGATMYGMGTIVSNS